MTEKQQTTEKPHRRMVYPDQKINELCAEVARLRTALQQIAGDWGDPVVLGTPDKALVRKWMADYNRLRNIAQEACNAR